MLGRGQRPSWNTFLTHNHASRVLKSLFHPLHRALHLQSHLSTTTRTILRSSTLRHKSRPPTLLPPSNRLYRLSSSDIALESDAFLSRSGPPNFEFPFTRDNYYMLLSYLPNRRWVSVKGEGEGGWIYYGALHENDLGWAGRMYEVERGRDEVARQEREKLVPMVGPEVGETGEKLKLHEGHGAAQG
jgi:hypothetical protein